MTSLFLVFQPQPSSLSVILSFMWRELSQGEKVVTVLLSFQSSGVSLDLESEGAPQQLSSQ